jgi:hypothetical protein
MSFFWSNVLCFYIFVRIFCVSMYLYVFFVFLCICTYFLCFYVFLCYSMYFCVVICIFLLFNVLFVLCRLNFCVYMCNELLATGGYPIAVKYIIKRLGRDADHPPASSCHDKNKRSSTSTPVYCHGANRHRVIINVLIFNIFIYVWYMILWRQQVKQRLDRLHIRSISTSLCNKVLFKMIVGVLASFSRCNPMWFLSMRLRQGSGLCSFSSRKYLRTEGTNQNRHWNHHRWHATNSLKRTRLSCW